MDVEGIAGAPDPGGTARSDHGDRPRSERRQPGRRVAEVQRQARWTFALAGGFAVASAFAALVPHRTGAWLPLHLLLVGAVLNAISGATQMLAVTWSSAAAPSRRSASIQRLTLTVGAAAVVTGREIEVSVVVAAGAALLAVALVLLAVNLWGVRQDARTPRFRPAIDGYLLAIVFGLVGVLLGAVLAIGVPHRWWAPLRGAHFTVNVFGLVGLVILATFPYFAATQARTRMSRRATSTRLHAICWWLGGATLSATLGYALRQPALVTVGFGGWVLGVVGVVSTLPLIGRRQLRWAGPRLVMLGAGLTWWVLCTSGLALETAVASERHRQLVLALVVGGIAQIVIGSMAYFGPVLVGGGHERLSAGFAASRSWVILLGLNVAAVALTVGDDGLAALALGAVAADAVLHVSRFVRACRVSPDRMRER